MADDDDDSGFIKVTKKSKTGEEHLENGVDDEPEFSDPEDFVDDITDEG